MLHWQFEAGKKFLKMVVLGYVFIYAQIKQKNVIPYTCLEIGETFKP